MALSTTVTRDLRRELERLKAYRLTVEARIDALKCILESSGESLTVDRKARARGSLSAPPRPSLRATILGTLEQLSKATPAELTGRLQQDGFQVGGSTTLRERVWHELSRLRRKGFVRRTRGGHYQLSLAKPSKQGLTPNSGDLKSQAAAVN